MPKKLPPLTDAQKKTVENAFKSLKDAFPGLSERQIIEGPLARHVLGDLPPWSNLETHKLTDVTTVLRGAFVICWYKKPDGEIDVVLSARPNKNAPGGKLYNASGGGYANPDFTEATKHHPAANEGEQPAQSAARELSEEIRDDSGTPVLDLDPARFRLIDAGVDNRAQIRHGAHPTDWFAFAVELTAEEYAAITVHCRKLAADPAYKAACKLASGNETETVTIMSMETARSLPSAEFAHPHEKRVLSAFANQLLAAAAPKPPERKIAP